MPPKNSTTAKQQQHEEMTLVAQMKHLLANAIDEINDNVNKKHDELMERLLSVEKTAKLALLNSENNGKRIQSLEEDLLKKSNKIKSLEMTLDDQVNRSMRSNLIFKGIPQGNKEFSWPDTTSTLASYLHTINPDRSVPDNIKMIDRCHRGQQRQGNKPRAIIAKFVDWKSAELVKNEIISYNKKSKNSTVIVSPQYTRKVDDQMNNALKRRKELVSAGSKKSMFVAYPGKLMGKDPGAPNYKVLEKFYDEDI